MLKSIRALALIAMSIPAGTLAEGDTARSRIMWADAPVIMDGGDEPGSLKEFIKTKNKFPYLLDDAGKQYDDDTEYAKSVLAQLNEYYPGATKYEIAGFFFWQGEKDCLVDENAARYEVNLVNFIKALRKDFNAPNAKFVLATLGEAIKGCGGNEEKVLEAQLAVDGSTGKHPEFKGNVATVFSHPLSMGGTGAGHYEGNPETYMNVGEAMGKAMVGLLKK